MKDEFMGREEVWTKTVLTKGDCKLQKCRAKQIRFQGFNKTEKKREKVIRNLLIVFIESYTDT